MLELRALRAERGGAEVLHGIDLKVEAGEVVGVFGPNGAGKSSLFRAICGLLRPSAGTVRFAGETITGRAAEKIARLGMALVPEGRQVFGTLSVAENLRLAARSPAQAEEVDRLMERFPILSRRAGQRADRLSGGEQQQLAIARALVSSPRLLVLDEPSMGLAPKMIDAIYEELASLRSEGLTMLLVEQNAARTIDFCERSLLISRGSIQIEGTREELQGNQEVLRAYLGQQL
jgi:branched-chain amino acid transport system ATP-binding protein